MTSHLAGVADKPLVRLDLEGKTVAPTHTHAQGEAITHVFPGGIEATGKLRRTGQVCEWFWSLANTSAQTSPTVTCFHPLSLQLPCFGARVPIVHGSTGGLDETLFPPGAWTQWRKCIPSEGLTWHPIHSQSSGGRSANAGFGFFIVEDARGGGGLVLALGWSGDWTFDLRRHQETCALSAGMMNLGLRLRPGERFTQPTTLIAPYQGDAAEGQRLLRRHLRDHVQPPLSGKPMAPVSFWDNYYGDRGAFTQASLLAEIPLADQAGFDYLVIDGGWTGGGEDGQFQSLLPHIGSWRPDPKRFPDGFAPLKNAFAGKRVKPGLWFDIERAHEDSLSFQNHPELYFDGVVDGGCHLLRLNRPAAVDHAFESIARNVTQLGARWLRFDFNSNPAAIWAHHDNPGQRGETEIRYIEGLYALLERILSHFPDLAIENCASGGRRIDLETIRRSHTDWISDHTQSEAIIRYHLHGALRWLPANHGNTSMAHALLEPHRPVNWKDPLPAAAYLSHFGGNFSVSDPLAPLTPAGRAEMARYIRLFRQTADAFAGDLYPLGQQDDLWQGPAGLAAIDPASGKRAVVFFGDPQAAARLVPPVFASLLTQKPLAGDAGNDQFTPATLWADGM